MATSYAPVVDAMAQKKLGAPGQNLSPDVLSGIMAMKNGKPSYSNANSQSWFAPGSPDSQYRVTTDYGYNYAQGDGGENERNGQDTTRITALRPDTAGKVGDWWNTDGTYGGEYEAQDGGGRDFNQAALMFGSALGGMYAQAGNAGSGAVSGMDMAADSAGMWDKVGNISATSAPAAGSTSGAWNGVDFSGPAGATGGTTAAPTAAGGVTPGAATTTAGTVGTAGQLMNGIKTVAPLVGAAATLGAGGGNASPGPAPDYVKQAIATGNSGKYDEVTPYGTITWSLRPGADPANPQPGDYIRTTNMSPEQEQLYKQNTGNQLQAGQIGSQQLTELGKGRQATEDALYARYTNRYDQNFGDAESQLRNKLANAGLNEGTEAFDRELRNFRQNKDDTYADATERSIAGANQQENDAVARIANIMALSKGTTPTSGNSAGGAPTDLLSAANQSYNANLGAANAQNAADAQQQNAWLQILLGGMKYYGG